MKRNAAQGFTLIEVLLVVAVMAVLTAIVLPIYKNYAIRARMAELLSAAGPCRSVVTEIYQQGGIQPAPGAWGCESNSVLSKYVGGLYVNTNGVIWISTRFTTSGELGLSGSAVLLLTPMNAAGTTPLVWNASGAQIGSFKCSSPAGSSNIPAQLLPPSCR